MIGVFISVTVFIVITLIFIDYFMVKNSNVYFFLKKNKRKFVVFGKYVISLLHQFWVVISALKYFLAHNSPFEQD